MSNAKQRRVARRKLNRDARVKFEPQTQPVFIIQDAGREFGKVLYGGEAKPYNQNPLFEMVPRTRSIEPHKKRRAK